ncbi:MAG: zf-HC2 domain-containing protein [Verrucomicrobiae bacterium]|nr:zf-HC2 domain-containing protein [Verrucomicrobiae bacterium]
MNCRRFQDQLFEYVEGSLSVGDRAAAEKHLAGCHACREAVEREEALAQDLSRRLRQRAEGLKLAPEIRRHILAAARRGPAPRPLAELIMAWWKHYAAPLSVGAAALVLGAILWLNHLPGGQKSGLVTAPPASRPRQETVSVQLSCRVPVCQFRREGNLIVDTLSVQTVAVSATFHPFPE